METYNPEAEQSVLGAILVRPEVLDQVADLLRPGHFYWEAHGLIFQAMLDLYGRHEPVDLPTVTMVLRERGQLDQVGGPVFLAALSEQVGFAVNARYYARRVWESFRVRQVRAKAKQILSQNPDGNLEEYLTWVQSQINEVTQLIGQGDNFPPLDGHHLLVSEYLKNPPPPRQYLFKDVLPANVVGELVAMGGTGKGNLIFQLGLLLATGKNIGPFKPPRKFKVLYLAGEDDEEELQRRSIAAIEVLWPGGSPPPEIDNFIPVSVIGQICPLMQFDGTNPANAPAYDWLCRSLANLPKVDVLILDPKSKFYGLNENDNSHCAAWISCLESLIPKFNITVLFAHHESKARAGNMEQSSSRGGSALTDGCRWVANIKTMDSKTAEKFQVDEPHNYLMLEITKSNYAPKLPAPVYFRRGAGGALSYVDLASERVRKIADRLLEHLDAEGMAGRQYSRRDLLFDKKTKHIVDDIKEEVQGFNRQKDIGRAIDHLLASGRLEECQVRAGKTGPKKRILRVRMD